VSLSDPIESSSGFLLFISKFSTVFPVLSLVNRVEFFQVSFL